MSANRCLWIGRRRAGSILCGGVLLLGGGVGCQQATETIRGSPVEVVWRATLEKRDAEVLSAPASDGTRVYFLGSGIVALDAGTGALLWRGPRFTQSQPTSLAVRNDRVFAAEAVAFAVDAETGRELWRAPLSASASLSQNAADEHAFYVGTRDHRVHALEVASGNALWQVDLGPEWPPYESLTKGISFSGDTVYAAVERAYSQNGYLSTGIIVALNRSTGRELWRHENGSGSTRRGIIGAPAAAGKLLVASDHRGNAF